MRPLGIDDTLNALLACVSDALDPAPCSVSTTVGTPAIGDCCDCGDGQGELWGNLNRVFRYEERGIIDATMQKPCAPVQWAAEFRIALTRCFPVMDQYGRVSAEAQAEAASRLHADLASFHRAIHCCGETATPYLADIGVETDPEGGCSILVATVRVPVSLKPSMNAAS